jgi:hypothetical protein
MDGWWAQCWSPSEKHGLPRPLNTHGHIVTWSWQESTHTQYHLHFHFSVPISHPDASEKMKEKKKKQRNKFKVCVCVCMHGSSVSNKSTINIGTLLFIFQPKSTLWNTLNYSETHIVGHSFRETAKREKLTRDQPSLTLSPAYLLAFHTMCKFYVGRTEN